MVGTVLEAAEETRVCMSLDVGQIDWAIARCYRIYVPIFEAVEFIYAECAYAK